MTAEASERVLLIAKFEGDVDALTAAYDRAHRLIMEAGGAPGELRHHCAVDGDALYLVGVWESEERFRTRYRSDVFRRTLEESGFPPMEEAELTVLRLHAIEPPLN